MKMQESAVNLTAKRINTAVGG